VEDPVARISIEANAVQTSTGEPSVVESVATPVTWRPPQ